MKPQLRKTMYVLLSFALVSFLLASLPQTQASVEKEINISALKRTKNAVGCSAYDIYTDAWLGSGTVKTWSDGYVKNTRAEGNIFTIYRSFLSFDTSSLEEKQINSAELWLNCSAANLLNSTFIMRVQAWDNGHVDALSTDDYVLEDPSDTANFDDGTALLSTWLVNQWTQVMLSDPSVINQTGWTFLNLRVNWDIEAVEPTDDKGWYATFYANSDTDQPYLHVHYEETRSAGGDPSGSDWIPLTIPNIPLHARHILEGVQQFIQEHEQIKAVIGLGFIMIIGGVIIKWDKKH